MSEGQRCKYLIVKKDSLKNFPIQIQMKLQNQRDEMIFLDVGSDEEVCGPKELLRFKVWVPVDPNGYTFQGQDLKGAVLNSSI